MLGIAEVVQQPGEWSSSLSVSSGPDIWDWQLSDMVSESIVPSGFSSMVFVFTECYGGGMIDNLQAVLEGRGDVVLFSASTHDEWAWFLSEPLFEASRFAWSRAGYRHPTSFFGGALATEISKHGETAPTAEDIAAEVSRINPVRPDGTQPDGSPWGTHSSGRWIVEHAQWVALGDGATIQIGPQTGSKIVTGMHAVLYGGPGDTMAAWREIESVVEILTERHAVPGENIHVLIGQGPDSRRPDGDAAPEFIDAPATLDALRAALRDVGNHIHANEQFLFWATGRGGRVRTTRGIDQVIREPGRTVLRTVLPPVPADPTPGSSPLWELDSMFLDDILGAPDNLPTVTLVVDGLDPTMCGSHLVVHLNDVPLACAQATPIDGWSTSDESELTGFVFWVWDESALQLENTIDVSWSGPAGVFTPYTVRGLAVSTGAIAAAPEVPAKPPRTPVELPAGAATIILGADGVSPPLAATLWADATFDFVPFRIMSRTDARIAPELLIAQAIDVGFRWPWWSAIAEVNLTLAPWEFVSVDGWIEFDPPTWFFGEMPEFGLGGSIGWGPRWAPTAGFSHEAGLSLAADIAWNLRLGEQPISLNAGTALDGSLEWPDWVLDGSWSITAGAGTALAISPAGSPVLSIDASTTASLLPDLGIGATLTIEIAAERYAAHAQMSVGTLSGFLFEIGAEYTVGWAWGNER